MKKLVIVLIVLLSINLLAQETFLDNNNPRSINRFGINANLGGPSLLLSLSLDYFFTPTINVETGAGIFGYYAGVKYHINGNRAEKNWTPYTGINLMYIPEITLFSTTEARNGLYIPVGVQYLSNSGFTFGAEIAGLVLSGAKTPVWAAIKIGYHF
jgi:hypothetical protein